MDNSKQTWFLVTEAVVLFVGLPLLIFWDLVPLPKILVLVAVASYCGYQLWWDPTFGRGIFSRQSSDNAGRDILIRTTLVLAGLVAVIWAVNPEQFFEFPTQRPIVWMVVMVLYPILSALPQELVYRTFFFHRYGDLISLRYGTVLSSALAFSFLHIIYDNWWAVGLSFIAGIMFGLTYKRTKSLFWVTVEHALYGCLVFTLGMGHYFYEAF